MELRSMTYKLQNFITEGRLEESVNVYYQSDFKVFGLSRYG